MKKKLFPAIESCLLILFLAALAGTPAGVAADSASSTATSAPPTTPAAASTVTCDFSNPGYSGWCRVTKTASAGQAPPRILLASAVVFERRALHPDLLQRNDDPWGMEAREGRNGAQSAVSGSPSRELAARLRYVLDRARSIAVTGFLGLLIVYLLG
jgi:hypothetical protein